MRDTVSGLGAGRATVVPVVRLSGVISANSPLGRGLSIAGVASLLDAAFSFRDAPAVALVINSPGGSPVQSALIHRRIRFLSEEKGKPVLAFVEDVAASGGYMIACAADEIFADPASIVGSIGVIAGGFGFDKAIERLGVDRRVYTAGLEKFRLDPFKPEDPADVAWLLDHLREHHRIFIDLVKSRRAEAFARSASSEDIFSGAYWLGEQGKALGLVDGIGELRSVLRTRFGSKVKLRPIVRRRSWMDAMSFSGRRMAVENAGIGTGSLIDPEALLEAAEARSLWSRYGL